MATKELHEFDCYAYLCVNHAHNIYPIQTPEKHLAKLLALRDGDRINIGGLGRLRVVKVNIDGFEYTKEGKNGAYQEIAIACEQDFVADWKESLDLWFDGYGFDEYD
jgi:hypothetical protein